MPLIVHTENCSNHDRLSEVDRYVIGTMMMAIGLTEIAEKNFEQVVQRVTYVEKMYGPFRWGVDTENPESGDQIGVYYTIPELREYIGLRVNIPAETDSKWLQRMWRGHKAEVRRRMDMQQQPKTDD